MRGRISGVFLCVMLLSLSLMRCRAKDGAPAPTPTPVETATPTATAAAETPMPTPTPTLEPAKPMAEFVVPRAMPVSETPTPTPEAPLPMDARLAEDGRRLAAWLDPIVRDADALDGQFKDYVVGCFQKYTTQKWTPPTGLDAGDRRSWMTVLDAQPTVFFHMSWLEQPTFTLQRQAEECEDQWKAMGKLAPTVLERVDGLDEHARRAGVLPGNLRALLKKHRLVR